MELITLLLPFVFQHFNKKQKNQLVIWTLHAVVANDLHTDDSFVVGANLFEIFLFL